MKINTKINQLELAKLFIYWEENYPIYKWEIGGILSWPLIKKNIYFSLFVPKAEKEKKIDKYSILKRAIKKGEELIEARLYLKSLKLKKTTFLFCSSYEQRVIFEEKEFNRFLEPLMDYLEEKKFPSYFFEYPVINRSTASRPDRIIDIQKLLVLFSEGKNRKKYTNELNQLTYFLDFLEEVYTETGIEQTFIERKIIQNILAIKSWEGVFTKIIKLTKPKYVLGLVYYSNPIYGMNLAANKMGVHSIDLQHGGLGPSHPAYYFGKIPEQGYNLLPKTFWAWNNSSYQDILKWAKDTSHQVINGGNPWIGFLNNVSNDVKGISAKNKPVILFTLQPLGDIISPYFLKVIFKTKDKFNWWLRFHPRMTEEERQGILDILEDEGVLKDIIYDYSSDEPLPIVLNGCSLHISQTSGSIIEAAMMQKFSLIINPEGVDLYKNIINDGWAEPCLSEDVSDIIKQINESLDKGSVNNKQHLIDYRETLDSLIKQ